jgi:hypothetical protein
MGFEPMNTGFADLQGAFALACTRFGPIVYSTDYRFHSQRIQVHLDRHPLHFPLQCPAYLPPNSASPAFSKTKEKALRKGLVPKQ